ncbi:MAG: DoxX family protein [Planctomycetes bacterium]|nr:DoxX family protein [Planctomycetota bacterium]
MRETSKSGLQDAGLLIIRAMVSVVLIYHGSQKLFGWFGGDGFEPFAKFVETLSLPESRIMAYAAAVSELFGGLLLLLGLAGRWPALPMAITMSVAVWKLHMNSFSGAGGAEYPLTLGVVLIGLLFTGPGGITLMRFFR